MQACFGEVCGSKQVARKRSTYHRTELLLTDDGVEMLRALAACGLLAFMATVAGEQEENCLLQAGESRPRRERRDDDDDDHKKKDDDDHKKKDDDDKKHSYRKRHRNKMFCKDGEAELNFESFMHGDIIKPDSIRGVTIVAERRRPGRPRCTGPLMILDTTKDSPDEDLKMCEKCFLMLYSHNGDQTTVADCGERPGVSISFKFWKVQDIVDIELWDNEEVSEVIAYDADGNEIQRLQTPGGPAQDGQPATLPMLSRDVRELVVNLGGSGAIRKIATCKPQGSVFGDPHIYTLDGEKFDLYESGTYSVFQYSGQKLALPQAPALSAGHNEVDWRLFAHYGGKWWWAQSLLLVDHSLGRFRQALELTSKDCQWRKRMAEESSWTPVEQRGSLSLLEGGNFLTGFQFHTSKKITLRLQGPNGAKDAMIINAVCKPHGINLRVSMPDLAESRFVEGQIEVGNGKKQKAYAMQKSWEALGGSPETAAFLQQTDEAATEHEALLQTPCSESGKAEAEATCRKYLGNHTFDKIFFDDCVTDVCRGGEDFAEAAAEMLSD